MIRRILIAVAVLLVCAGALAFALPGLMSSQFVREEVARQLSELTDRNVTLRGDQALQVFPNLSVELSDVVIEGDVPGADTALIITETLRGAVRPWPLLFGRIQLATLELTRPTIQLLRDADGQANWGADGGALLRALDQNRPGNSGTALGRFRITDGTLLYADAATGVEESFTGADLTLRWPSNSTRASLSGTAIWRGEAVELSASLDQPSALAQVGSTSGVVLAISAAPLNLQFNGALTPGDMAENGGPWQASGSVAVATPSLRRATNWLGADMGTGSAYGAFELEAAMNLVGLVADLTQAQLNLDGNEAEGVLTLDLKGLRDGSSAQAPVSLQGTLDFESLDLSAYLDGLRPTTTAQVPGDWRFAPVPDLLGGGLNADIRFATRELRASSLTLGETAGSLLIAQNQLSLGIAEALGYDGSLRGSLTLESDGADTNEPEKGAKPDEEATQAEVSVAATLDLSMDGVQLESLLASLVDEPPLAGALTARALLSGNGATLGALLASLEGDASLEVTDGAISGLDLDSIAQSFVDGSFDLEAPTLGGQSDVEQLSAALVAREGFVQVPQLTLESQQISLNLIGGSALESQSLAFEGATAVTRDGETLVVPFTLRGTWSEPQLTPDLRDLDQAGPAN